MPEIHYTDAILTVLFGAGSSFMLWSFFKLGKLDKRLDLHALKSELSLKKFEKRLAKKIRKANERGAESVKHQFKQLMEQKHV